MTQPTFNEPVQAPLAKPVRTRLYIMLVLLAALGGYVYTLRENAIFSCPADGYGTDNYLAYCHAPQYGDYDHGAFWFALEPGIRDYVTHAQVLFLGNSRVQFGFSGNTTRRWMADVPASYFLMGFAYWENYTFERALLQKARPTARAYIVNMDGFFDISETEPAKAVMYSNDLVNHYRAKRFWQWPHQQICSRSPRLCGGNEAFFRSLKTGDYVRFAGETGQFPVAYDPTVDTALVADYVKRAAIFFATLPVDKRCVLITMVPGSQTRSGNAQAFADALGVTLIAPQLDGLSTFDRSHLDAPSAQRWSQAFFDAAGPRIRTCLGSAALAAR